MQSDWVLAKEGIGAKGWLEALRRKGGDYWLLVKGRLSSLVLFTVAVGYWMAAEGEIRGMPFLLTLLGAFCVIGAANAFNEIWEREADARMRRTANRPLPAGRMTTSEAMAAAVLMTGVGLATLLWGVNPRAALLAGLAEALYVLAYTPLKRRTPLCTLVGAIPGAIPPLLGWAAVRGELGGTAWALFLIQFLWQFPHFWLIAWLYQEDYARVGWRLLPSLQREPMARQIWRCQCILLLVSLLPPLVGVGGTVYLIGALLSGLTLMAFGWRWWRAPSRRTGRHLMLATTLYLPTVMGLMVLGQLSLSRP